MIVRQRRSVSSADACGYALRLEFRRSSATVHTVRLANYIFLPAKTHVAHGDTVRWVWSNGFHTSTSDASSPKQWSSPDLSGSGQSFEVVFVFR